ncbi:MAG: AAA family ATPase [Actinobacteria bacterium]|nr:AAA family ATPase [Actinomycetota bacterium]
MVAVPRSGLPALVAGIPRAARLHIVTGKGGAGKTTTAAALAIALARGGQRVLIVEVEGRQALARLFDVPELPYADRHLAAAPGGGEVVGLSIDPEEAFIDYLELFYNMKRSARIMQRMGAVDFVTTLAPGLRDVLLTGKVKERVTLNEQGRSAYDCVVLDAPPTGRIRQFLDATREVANLARFGPINRQSQGVVELLHSERTVVHLVTLLEEMPVQETVDAAHELTEGGFGLGAIVVNRARPHYVRPGQLADGRLSRAVLRRGLKLAGVDVDLTDELAQQMIEYEARQDVQRANADRLDAVAVPRIELPELAPPVGVGELSELSDYFVIDE